MGSYGTLYILRDEGRSSIHPSSSECHGNVWCEVVLLRKHVGENGWYEGPRVTHTHTRTRLVQSPTATNMVYISRSHRVTHTTGLPGSPLSCSASAYWSSSGKWIPPDTLVMVVVVVVVGGVSAVCQRCVRGVPGGGGVWWRPLSPYRAHIRPEPAENTVGVKIRPNVLHGLDVSRQQELSAA